MSGWLAEAFGIAPPASQDEPGEPGEPGEPDEPGRQGKQGKWDKWDKQDKQDKKPESSVKSLRDAVRGARAWGKPILVLVIPKDDDRAYVRGGELGGDHESRWSRATPGPRGV